MHGDCERILFTEEQIKARIKEIAPEIDKAYAGRRPLVVGVLKGSIIFYADLIRSLSFPCELDFISVSSYGAETASSGKIDIKKDMEANVSGRDVIIVDDIIDSGLTLKKLKTLLTERGAASVSIVTLLDKKERRECDIGPDYNCFDIGGGFIVGYGLDYCERYRSLPYIAVLKKSVYE